MLKTSALLLATAVVAVYGFVDYSGYKVLSVTPTKLAHVELIHKLRSDYGVDLWNEPRMLGKPILFHLKPDLVNPVKDMFYRNGIDFEVTIEDLQTEIMAEKMMNAPSNVSYSSPPDFDFGKYHGYEDIVALLKDLAKQYPDLAKLESAGQSYENRPIYNMKISSGKSENKPAIMMECGLHAREWSAMAAGVYLVNKLLTTYGTDKTVTSLVDKYEFNIIVQANPDGFIFSWKEDRLWRKTRSRSSMDWSGACKGVDANRNFDVDHCGLGTSKKPCDEEYCGEKPFSESESRALRNLMIALGSRIKAFFSIHAYSQYWMTPYGNTKALPDNYDELTRVGKAGTAALAKKYGTEFEFGTISNVIYEATGSAVDYAYKVQGIKIAYALELRDNGRYGFILPKAQIIPMCEETFDGLVGAIEALE